MDLSADRQDCHVAIFLYFPLMMHALIQEFPQQLKDALTRFGDLSAIEDLLSKKEYTAVLCIGMGGSGIAGTLIQTLMNYD